MVKVSVIIPVYNAAANLRQCLDSVCNQTLKEIEIICVDDGSTDDSFAILEEYQKRDSRMQIYKQKNQYAGVARNNGMSHATGEYLLFWDADDFFETTACEHLYARAKAMDADICVCGGCQYHEEWNKLISAPGYLVVERLPKEEVFNRASNEKYILNFTNAAAWNKIFRREFILEQGLLFQPIRNGNDVYFTICSICLANRVTTLDEALVNYRISRKGGLVHSLSKSPVSPIQTWMDAADTLIAKNAFPEQSFANKALGSMIYLLRNIKDYSAFLQAYELLKTEGLSRMHIVSRPDGYYYKQWQKETVDHMWQDSPEELLIFLAYRSFLKMTETDMRYRSMRAKKEFNVKRYRRKKAELADAKEEILKLKNDKVEIKNSLDYRLGHWLLKLPRKIKQFFKRKEGIR